MSWKRFSRPFALLVASGILASCGGGSSTSSQNNGNPVTGVARFNGSFVFSVTGIDPSDGDYAVTGSMASNGTGGVTGIEDLNLGSGIDSSAPFVGTYSVDSNGNVTVFLSGGSGTPTFFSFPIPSGSSSVKVSYDGTGNGTLQAQSTNGFSNAGNFSFTLSGEGEGMVTASGSFSLNSAGQIAAGTEQYQDGSYTRNTAALSGVLSPAFAGGRGTAVIGSNLFSYYVVSQNQIILAGLEETNLLYGTATKQ